MRPSSGVDSIAAGVSAAAAAAVSPSAQAASSKTATTSSSSEAAARQQRAAKSSSARPARCIVGGLRRVRSKHRPISPGSIDRLMFTAGGLACLQVGRRMQSQHSHFCPCSESPCLCEELRPVTVAVELEKASAAAGACVAGACDRACVIMAHTPHARAPASAHASGPLLALLCTGACRPAGSASHGCHDRQRNRARRRRAPTLTPPRRMRTCMTHHCDTMNLRCSQTQTSRCAQLATVGVIPSC